MKPTGRHGVFSDRGFMWTKNRVPGTKVYGERLRSSGPDEYRHWTPHRSKVAAMLQNLANAPWPKGKASILYLGASSGTTVSHLSDIFAGPIFAVEFSPRSARELLWNMQERENVIPILADANQPRQYEAFLEQQVDVIVQDVAQRHQVEIFLANRHLAKPGALGYLFVKARSINVRDAPKTIYNKVATQLLDAGLEIIAQADLEPFEIDHRAFVVKFP